MLTEQVGQYGKHVMSLQLTLDMNAQTFAAVLVEIRFRRSKPFNAKVKEANESDSDSDVCNTAGKPPENQAADEPDLRLIYAAIAS